MHTLMLRAIRHPAHVDELLRELLRSVDIVPEDAYEIFDRDAVPAELQPLVHRALHAGLGWSVWVDDDRHAWLFVAQMLLDPSRERGVPVLHVDQFREDGRVVDTGTWIAEREGHWTRSSP